MDDDTGTCKALEQLLGNAGYDVASVRTGEGAIERCNEQPPDVLILDAGLPGVDGYEACDRIRREVDAPEMAVVFLTGAVNAGTNTVPDELVTRAGGDCYLSKPYDPHLLIRLLDNITAETARRPEHGRRAGKERRTPSGKAGRKTSPART